LDIPTINILEEYLQSFDGALLFVSHDRYFVDKIAKKLFIFEGEGVIKESYQSYSEYLEIKEYLKEINSFEKSLKKPKINQPKPKKTKKLSYKENLEYEKLPKEIEELEQEVKKLEECLSDVNCYSKEGLVTLSQKLQETKELLDSKIDRFLELDSLV
jgi:ATP-binding cassette subfamily F protein uup